MKKGAPRIVPRKLTLKRLLLTLAAASAVFFAADVLLPASAVKAYRYDERGRLVALVAPGGRVRRYGYDRAGLLSGVSYHRAGSLTRWVYPSREAVEFEYDPAGNRVAMKDATGITKYVYDDFNRLAAVTTPDGRGVAYEYDPWDNVRALSLDGGRRFTYQYDLRGEVRAVSDGRAGVSYEHDAERSRVIRRTSDGISSVYEFGPAGRLSAIRHFKADDSLICAYHYDYDVEDRVSAVEERTPRGASKTFYEYDLAGRLSKVTESDGATVSYKYDAMGNRVSQTDARGTTLYTYDAQGRLARAGDTTYTYDAAGNLVSKRSPAESVAYEYDGENRLVKISGGAHTLRYSYDGDGNRVRREAGGHVTTYVNDSRAGAPQVLAEYEDGQPSSHYLIGRNRVARRDARGATVYFLEDHLGSTRCVVDGEGRVLARYAYTPFGAPTLVEGSPQTEFLFAGEQWDEEAQLVYLRARFYDPHTGRFLSTDPVPGTPAAPETYNQYVYVNNDPLNLIDPLGLQGQPPPFQPTPMPTPRTQPAQTNSHFPRQDYSVWRRHDTPHVSPFRPDPVLEALRRYENQRFNRIFTHSAGTGAGQYLNDLGITSNHPVVNFGGAAYPGASNFRLQRDPVPLGIAGLGLGSSRGQYEVLKSSVPLWRSHDFTNYMTAYTAARGPVPPDASILFVSGIWTNQQEANDAVKGLVTSGVLRSTANVSVVAPFGNPGLFGPLRDLWNAHRTFRNVDPDRSGGHSLNLPGRKLFDELRNLFPPLPPGGGGGGAGVPKVGGVYLDQTARVIGELGAITGAAYDPASGRVTLVGDRGATLPPMRPEYLAAAIRAVYSESAHEPGMTIDPNPQDPHGAVMVVRFFGNTENTRLGWVMFEADRAMKSYSIGTDNLTGQPVRSAVPGYQSVTSLLSQAGTRNGGMWSRFWLVPDPVTARVSDDGRAVIFDPVRMRVRTETMRLAGGRLVPAGGAQDPAAEAFAAHFTEHYEEFARENAVYAELKLVAQTVALAKWMKQQGVPVDWNFVRVYAGRPFATPQTTPAARGRVTRAEHVGGVTRTLQLTTFGGVDADVRLQPQKDAQAGRLQSAVLQAQQRPSQDARPFGVRFDERDYAAASLPVGGEREPAGYSTTADELSACVRAPERAAGLPGLARHYNSLHNEPTEFGFSWSLQLPRLEFEAAREGAGAEHLTVGGDPRTRVLVQHFTLTNQFGVAEQRFVSHFIDQNTGRIGFKPETAGSPYRALYPEADGNYRLLSEDGRQTVFDSSGRLRAVFAQGAKALYDYDAAGSLLSLSYAEGEQQPWRVVYELDDDGRVKAADSGDGRVTYDYDGRGDLRLARCEDQAVAYSYDERHLLVSASVNGRPLMQNSYDGRGRLTAHTGANGERLEQSVEATADGRVVTLKNEADSLRLHYDGQSRITKIEDGAGNSLQYTYDEAGGLVGAEQALANGAKATLAFSPDKGLAVARDPRGVQTEYRFTHGGALSEIRVNGRRASARRYDDRGHLSEVQYEGGYAEHFAYDGEGRVREYRRSAPGADEQTADRLTISYDAAGRPTRIDSPYYDPHESSESAGGAGGSAVNYFYRPDHELQKIEATKEGRVGGVEFERGRMVLRRSLAGGQFRYAYTPEGSLRSVTDPYGEQTFYVYDGRNRLQRVGLPDGRCIEYVYSDAPTGKLAEERVTTGCR